MKKKPMTGTGSTEAIMYDAIPIPDIPPMISKAAMILNQSNLILILTSPPEDIFFMVHDSPKWL